jgi:RNA polymerase sigma-70 factor (ECF subfamily)
MPPLEPEQSRWFAAEVQPHEATLRSWLHGQYPSLPDVDDLIQETYVRVLRMRSRDPGRLSGVKSLLFTIARNLALDQLRHRQVVKFEAWPETEDQSNATEDRPGIQETVSQRQELEMLTEAIQALPERCRQVLTLRKLYGLSQKEIAAQLGIAEHTVEAHVGAGLRRCTEYFARRGASGARS